MSENLKSKLEELKKSKDWDDSSLKLFEDWSKQIDDLEINWGYLKLPTTIKVCESLKTLVEGAAVALDDRNLSEKDRQYNFALRDVASMVYNLLSPIDIERSLKSIEYEVDEELKKD